MLNPKQQRFADEYLIDLNATQAAIRAGYSQKTANEQGARLLVNVSVREYLQKRKEKLSSKLQLTQESVLEAYRRLAFYDARKFYDEGGTLLPVTDLDEETAFALTGFEVTEESNQVGKARKKIITLNYTKKIKMSDRKGALDSICKVLGFNTPEGIPSAAKGPTTIKTSDGTIITL